MGADIVINSTTKAMSGHSAAALHMASTIYSDFDKKSQKYLGITKGLIRISIGLEDAKVIAKIFLQASNT